MTTIIFKDGEMYADSRTTSGHSYNYIEQFDDNHATKILNIDERLFGFAGTVDRIENFISWLNGDDLTDITGEYSQISSLEWDGENLWKWTEDFSWHLRLVGILIGGSLIRHQFNGYKKVKIKKSFYAIGSGTPYAMRSLRAGHTAEEAMEFAILNDPSTGGKINRKTIKDIIEECHILDPLFDFFVPYAFTSATWSTGGDSYTVTAATITSTDSQAYIYYGGKLLTITIDSSTKTIST